MKTRTSIGKKRAARGSARSFSGVNGVNLPRLFLFLEVFVEKGSSERLTK